MPRYIPQTNLYGARIQTVRLSVATNESYTIQHLYAAMRSSTYANEESRSDCSSQCEHLCMPRFQAALRLSVSLVVELIAAHYGLSGAVLHDGDILRDVIVALFLHIRARDQDL